MPLFSYSISLSPSHVSAPLLSSPAAGRMPKGLWKIGLMRLEGVRGLAVVKNRRGVRKLWVANEDVYGVMIFNVLTGMLMVLGYVCVCACTRHLARVVRP